MQIKLCYFNQRWNPYIYTTGGYESWCKEPELITVRDESLNHSGEYRLRTYACPEVPIFTYGFMTDRKEQRPGHNGEWSSNCKNINNIFNRNIIEAAVDGIACAVPLEWLKEELGDYPTWSGGDHIHVDEIKHIIGIEKPKDMQWIEIPQYEPDVVLPQDRADMGMIEEP